MSIKNRILQPEIMDQPGLDPVEHGRALDALARVNFLSRTAGSLASALRAFQHRRGLAHLRILDVASGGGDVARALARPGWAVDGCDFSPTAVAHAQRRGGRFFIHDALADPIPEQYDALTCSLFVHHLSEDQTIQLFRRFAESSARFIVISDLNRCRTGLFLAYVVSRLLTRSPVVHYDGPVSVRAAFTLPEVRNLAHQAGLHGAQVRRCWPFRWLLTWERP